MCDKGQYIKKLNDIIKDKDFIIPLYQRNYKWGYKEIAKLMSDFIKIYKEGEKQQYAKNKSIGLLTLYKKENKENEYYVIDGQQRLITLQIIFSVLIEGEKKGDQINLKFERDEENNKCRYNAVYCEDGQINNTEVDRIKRNKEFIKEILSLSKEEKLNEASKKEFEEKLNKTSKEERQFFINDEIKNFIDTIDRGKFKEFLLENCTMLCSYINSQPIDEFMNLNAYKTKFSICDHIRANMISLNSFYRDELEKKNAYLADVLDKHSYKSAIAHLYNDILKLLYDDNNIFDYLWIKNKDLNPDDSNESRINFLFVDRKEGDTKQGYHSDSINENMEYWIKMILKLACVKRILIQLKEERDDNNFSSLKKISDYQELKEKNFLRFNIMEIDKEYDEINTLTLAELLKEKSNVASILFSDLDCGTDQRLANRYLESFVESSKERKTNIAEEYIFKLNEENEENEENEKVQLYTMSKEKLFEEIQGIGKHIINRYIIESRKGTNTKISIAPLMNLEDTENVNFGGKLELDNEISVGELFRYNIKIPVIQRDYCMGYQINENNDGNFLEFLLTEFVNFCKKGKEEKKIFKTVISTIVIAVENEKEDNGKKKIYIFDGQQRTYTLYIILKYLYDTLGMSGEFDEEYGNYQFVGRDSDSGKSPYSNRAEKNLNNVLGEALQEINNILNDKTESEIIWWKMLKNKENSKEILGGKLEENLIKYLEDQIKFKVQIVTGISDAEQFFMDINGGVELEKYEIFKSVLYNHLSGLKLEDIIRQIENEWLQYFYNWRKKLKKDNQDESNEEEILEMRFIEYICRFIYNKKDENKNDLWKEEDVFDVYTSKSEIVAKESKYITKLDSKDIDKIVKIMESIKEDVSAEKHQPSGNLGGILQEGEINKGSKIYVGKSYDKDKSIRFINFILSDESDESDEIKGTEVLYSFIWSLCESNREKYKEICKKTDKKVCDRDKEIIKVYDNDIILKEYFKNKLSGGELNINIQEFSSNKDPFFILAGYNIGLIQIDQPSLREIPFYYAWKEIEDWSTYDADVLKYIEVSSIYNKGKNTNVFALAGKDGNKEYTIVKDIERLGIKDINNSPICRGNNNEYSWEVDEDIILKMNQRDAYILSSKNARTVLDIK